MADPRFELSPLTALQEGITFNCIAVVNLLVCVSCFQDKLPRSEDAFRKAQKTASDLWKFHLGVKGLEAVSAQYVHQTKRSATVLTTYEEAGALLDSLRDQGEFSVGLTSDACIFPLGLEPDC